MADIEVIIPIPETSSLSTLAAAAYLNKPYAYGLARNNYVFRTFLLPHQKLRLKGVWRKLNVIPEEFQNKHVLLIDDSIVRGVTSKEIVKMAREAGARKVTLASCSPPIRQVQPTMLVP